MIDPAIRARYRSLKGGEFAHTDIDPSRVAHLVIDMQHGFLAEGELLEVPEARTIVDNVNAVSAAVRAGGGITVYLQFTTTTEDDWPAYFRRFQNPDFAAAEVRAFRSGSPGHMLWPELIVEPGDLVLNKTRFSAFTLGSSDLAEQLAARGIDTVIISGTLTDCCCDATARDAQQLGYGVIVISDGTAALSDVEHNASINALAAWFADIRTASEAVDLLASR
ncbi:MAG: cysteine hydrolase family protein [Pseudoclavibacter sp.]